MNWKDQYPGLKGYSDDDLKNPNKTPWDVVVGNVKKKPSKIKRTKSWARERVRLSAKKGSRLKSRRLKKTYQIRGERKLGVGTRRLVSALLPVEQERRSLSYGKDKYQPKRRVGRPRGPSGRYYVPGVGPVGVYEWRRWYRNQLALQRTEAGTQPQRDYSYEESPPESPQQIQQAPPQYQYEQRRTILTPQENNILRAPNFMKGELNSVGRSSSLINVDDLNRPITNQRGDYYTEVDPASGKQILRRRIRERWLSNE